MASRYHDFQLPALSPATSRMALRHGSKTNRTRSSLVAVDPGRSSFRLCSDDPLMRSTSGLPRFGPTSARASIAETTSRRAGITWRPAPGGPELTRSRGDIGFARSAPGTVDIVVVILWPGGVELEV